MLERERERQKKRYAKQTKSLASHSGVTYSLYLCCFLHPSSFLSFLFFCFLLPSSLPFYLSHSLFTFFYQSLSLTPAKGIHILINLNGYTKGSKNEIFALRPAPIQLSYLGFCGTMAAPEWNHYLVTDKTCVPPKTPMRDHYTESMLYMPHCHIVTDHKQSARDVLDPEKCKTREDYGLSDDRFVGEN